MKRPANGWKPKPDALHDDTTGRCNFRLPIKTFNLMLEMAQQLGIESTSGAARHFCLRGIEGSMAQYAAYRSAMLNASSVETNAAAVGVQQGMLDFMKQLAEAENAQTEINKEEDTK